MLLFTRDMLVYLHFFGKTQSNYLTQDSLSICFSFLTALN